MSSQLLNTDQVATKLNMNPQSIRNLAKSGELIAIKIGKDWRFEESDVEAFIAERKAKTAEAIKKAAAKGDQKIS